MDNTHLRFQVANISPTGLTQFLESSTLALIFKKGNLGFAMCHVSWFSPMQHRNVWSSFLSLYPDCCSICSLYFKLLGIHVAGMLTGPAFSFSNMKYLGADIPTLTLTAMTTSVTSVLTHPSDSAASGGATVGYFRSAKRCQLGRRHRSHSQSIATTWPAQVSIRADPSRGVL